MIVDRLWKSYNSSPSKYSSINRIAANGNEIIFSLIRSRRKFTGKNLVLCSILNQFSFDFVTFEMFLFFITSCKSKTHELSATNVCNRLISEPHVGKTFFSFHLFSPSVFHSQWARKPAASATETVSTFERKNYERC